VIVAHAARHGVPVIYPLREFVTAGGLSGVTLAAGEIVEGNVVVIAMGPWSILAARWLP
jgi:hypothetical protein